MALIEARKLTLANRLDAVSFTLAPGEMLAVIGPNGAGKSSLLQSLAGLLPAAGEILLSGIPLAAFNPTERARQIGFLPQFCDSAWALAVEEIVTLGRLPWHDRDAEAIRQAMRETGVEGMAQKNINQLSGGEQARVWLARVLAGAPGIIIADEPVASLDLYYQAKIMAILRQHARAGRGVILAIHDLALAARYCDRFCLLKQGRIHAFGPPEAVLTEAALSDAFNVPIHVDLAHSPPIILPA
ncbi:MAG: ABC transporter ATP-binding protein [Betaproteobacteria bacterium]|nr:ABC transporter ATP-binding protein [Betaproteobacteria bacterium]MCL2885571.1 ABC transporter ATP-binding protein [Betaproteobacteria bacterium]